MSLQEYLGPKLFTDIRDKAIKDSANFIQQSGATKLELADNLKIENNVLREGVGHLVHVIDDTEADNELLEKENKYYRSRFGEINKDYIEKGELTVIRTPELAHAKRALTKYIQKYEAENGNKEQKKVQPSPQILAKPSK